MTQCYQCLLYAYSVQLLNPYDPFFGEGTVPNYPHKYRNVRYIDGICLLNFSRGLDTPRCAVQHIHISNLVAEKAFRASAIEVSHIEVQRNYRLKKERKKKKVILNSAAVAHGLYPLANQCQLEFLF